MQNYKNPLAAKKDKPKIKTYNFTAEQLRQYQDAAQREGYAAAIYICNAMYTAAMLTSLRECLGFGQRRLKYIHDQVQKNFAAIRDGEISYADIAQALMDECRINLVIERPDGVSKDIQEIFAAMGKQPWHKLRIRLGGKDGKAD